MNTQSNFNENVTSKNLIQSEQKIDQSTQSFEPIPVPRRQIIRKFPRLGKYSKIVKNLKNRKQLPMLLKKGTNSPKHHIFYLFETMSKYQQYYIYKGQNYFKRAYDKVKNLIQNVNLSAQQNKKQSKSYNLEHLNHIYGLPEGERGQNFIINRMNARVLDLIYEEHMQEFIFSPKIEDKMTNMLFFLQYRSRLLNPLLCKGLQCERPLRRANQ